MARRTIRGFAWLVFPDARPPGDPTEPGRPFGGDKAPADVVDFWPISAEFGIANDQTGDSLLVVTQTPEPPRINPTHKVAPAQFREGDQIGGGLVRLVRMAGTRATDQGDVRECEFEADDDIPIEEEITAADDAGVQAGPATHTNVAIRGAEAGFGGRSAATRQGGASIGMGAGAAGNQGTPLGGDVSRIQGAAVGQNVGPGITAGRNAIKAGQGESDDPARSIASPDEITNEIGKGEEKLAGA